MKVILSAAICVMLTAAVPLFAQDPTTPDPPSREQVVRFLDLMQVRARLVQVTDSMKKNMKAGAEAGLRQRLPNPTPEQIEKVDGFADAVFQDFPTDELVAAMVPIYQRHLTKSDLDAIVAFYDSPSGKKLLKEQPAMMSESMEAGQDIMLQKVGELSKRLDGQIAQLADEEKKKSRAAKGATSAK